MPGRLEIALQSYLRPYRLVADDPLEYLGVAHGEKWLLAGKTVIRHARVTYHIVGIRRARASADGHGTIPISLCGRLHAKQVGPTARQGRWVIGIGPKHAYAPNPADGKGAVVFEKTVMSVVLQAYTVDSAATLRA